MEKKMTKAGYVTIIGMPNAGKSTLMNAWLGEKLSITTSKPQTTRKKILGLLTTENEQIIFLDTPGILDPAYLLQEKMVDYVIESSRDADILVAILDMPSDPDGSKLLKNKTLNKIVSSPKSKKLLLINKIDKVKPENLSVLMEKIQKDERFDEVIPISALEKFNLEKPLEMIREWLPEHPYYYPEDEISDRTERFFVSEIIREKIFELFHDEVPFSTEVVIEQFKEREKSKDYIEAAIIVEKESQKPIIIGKNGSKIKVLGQKSREAAEEFLQRPVFLELRVKVKARWRQDASMLKNFGYEPGE